jgi:hypothetical protein
LLLAWPVSSNDHLVEHIANTYEVGWFSSQVGEAILWGHSGISAPVKEMIDSKPEAFAWTLLARMSEGSMLHLSALLRPIVAAQQDDREGRLHLTL